MIPFILGRIIGKVTTGRFDFLVEHDTRKFGYCQVYHKQYDYVLCQVAELEKTSDRVIARATVIGYKDPAGHIKQIRSPFDVGTEVLKADDDFVKSVIMLDQKKGAYIGLLEAAHIHVYLDLNRLLTKHVAILAKSGSGKSYTVGVLLEEIMDKGVPLLVIDPHGEYLTLKQPNDSRSDLDSMERFGISPKGYAKKISVYGDMQLDPGFKPLKLNENLKADELLELLPTKLSNAQMGILYSAVKGLESLTLESLILELQAMDNNLKWNIINILDYLRKLNLFSPNPTSLNEIIRPGRCSILNLKGMEPQVQEILLCKLLRDLFHERKVNKVPPFFLVIEEAHNFVPEKGFHDARSSRIIKTIASEGRKFGLGLCVVSQRPAIVQKTVLSQCTTQIILKITNPNDLKAVGNSVEGLTGEAENEIRNLPVGTALVTGIVDMPLFVNIRPRKTKHGGEAVDILGMQDNLLDELKEYKDQNLLPLIKPKITPKDIRLMSEQDVKIRTILIPCTMFLCQSRSREFSLLVEMVKGSVVQDIEGSIIKSAFLPDLDLLSRQELRMLQASYKLKAFSGEEFIEKTGFALDSLQLLDLLCSKGLLEKEGERFRISEAFILSELSKHAFFGRIDYGRIPYDDMLEKSERLDSVKARIRKYAEVKDHQDCFLVHYAAEDAGQKKDYSKNKTPDENSKLQ